MAATPVWHFDDEQDSILKGIHPVLAKTLLSVAYDRGHSAGRDEVNGILRGLVMDFSEVNDLLLMS